MPPDAATRVGFKLDNFVRCNAGSETATRYAVGREVYFAQCHRSGEQSQPDFTDMRSLGVTIAGVAFEHLAYHFALTYSNWESVSRDVRGALGGIAGALWRLRGVQEEQRTDNLAAATHELE